MRSYIDKRNSRLDLQRIDSLNKISDAIVNEQANAEKEYLNTIFETAYADRGAYLHKKRIKEQNDLRAYSYNEHFAIMGMTEILSECAERALLLNTEEYKKLNENYQTEIKTAVRGFLENADINEKIDNKFILEAYKLIAENTPQADLMLTEENEVEILRDHIMNNATIQRGIDKLSRDVRARVANIVSKDQEALAKEQDDLSYADEKELEKAPVVPVVPEEELPLEDPEAVPVEKEPEAPQQVITEEVKPTLKIVRENKVHGVFETLTMNEAAEMISNGKEYDKTLAMANALKFITVLEAMDASGLVSIGKAGYNRILNASGVNMNPTARVVMPGAELSQNAVVKETDIKPTEAKEELKKDAISSKISEIVKSGFDGIPTDNRVFEPYTQWKQQKIDAVGTKLGDIPVMTEDLKGKYTNMKGEVFTEAQLQTYFENQGFDLNYVDFSDLVETWHFKKH